jgi:phosphatidylserine/phosphatidylglycerophosphate/cardiolipin synthase-like enzyme
MVSASAMVLQRRGGPVADSIAVIFLRQGAQTADAVAQRFVAFIDAARQSLDIAAYDVRLSPPLLELVGTALRARLAAGVAVRIVYDADKPEPPNTAAGQDPAPPGTGSMVQALGVPWRRIGGPKLMHHKYMVRDAGTPDARVWTGSTNFTDDSWTLQENNIVELASPALAGYYARDFADLWRAGAIGDSGDFDTTPETLSFAAQPARVEVCFSPGKGQDIDAEVARLILSAQRRVRVCSMLLNSSAFLNALTAQLDAGRVRIDGVYDQTQMEGVFQQWQLVPHNLWKIPAAQDIIARAQLVGKRSTPYAPDTPHDFMHNKVLVIDDTVITGSYNFSRSAEANAENILTIESAPLAEAYCAYIGQVMGKIGSVG